MTDEQLAARAHNGDPLAWQALLARYDRLTRHLARGYYTPVGDRADLHQEALIGFTKAVRDYHHTGTPAFRGFLVLCIRRQLQTALTAANRAKHQPLTHAHRTARNDDGDTVEALDLCEAAGADPADRLIERERLDTVRAALASLSALERAALDSVLQGRSYADTERMLGYPVGGKAKVVDNALARARAKLRAATSEAA